MRLATNYLGFKLPNPLIVGASPMCDSIDFARKLEDSGAAMLTLRSLFQEQLAVEQQFTQSSAYLNDPIEFRLGPEEYLEHIGRLKSAVSVPVVASLNCQSDGSWTTYAGQIEDAGADALELNMYNPVVRIDQSSGQIEEEIIGVVQAVRAAVRLPLAVKLVSNYTALPHFAAELARAGVRSLVLFNRPHLPEMDLKHLGVHEELKLSTPRDLTSRFQAVAALAGRVHCDLAITGGVHTAADVLRATLAGADAVQMVSCLLKQGPYHVGEVLNDMVAWLHAHDFETLSQVRGAMSLLRTPAAKAGARRNFIAAVNR